MTLEMGHYRGLVIKFFFLQRTPDGVSTYGGGGGDDSRRLCLGLGLPRGNDEFRCAKN